MSLNQGENLVPRARLTLSGALSLNSGEAVTLFLRGIVFEMYGVHLL